MAKLICTKCSEIYDSAALRTLKCPSCRIWLESLAGREVDEPHVDLDDVIEEEELDPNTLVILQASNRTTHAVRSLAIFFFTLLRVNLIGGGLVGIGMALSPFQSFLVFQNDNYAFLGYLLIIAGGLVSFIGFFVALSRGMRELALSKP